MLVVNDASPAQNFWPLWYFLPGRRLQWGGAQPALLLCSRS